MRIDEWWVIRLAEVLYGSSPPGTRFWYASVGAFRKRWNCIGEALEVDVSQGTGLTPASLRAGGATSHFEFFEDIPKLQRRARWADPRSAEVYVQEVAPYEYLASLDPRKREKLFRVAEFFEDQVHEALAA